LTGGVVVGFVGLAVGDAVVGVNCPGVAELAGVARQVAVTLSAHPAATRTLASVTAIAVTSLLRTQAW